MHHKISKESNIILKKRLIQILFLVGELQQVKEALTVICCTNMIRKNEYPNYFDNKVSKNTKT